MNTEKLKAKDLVTTAIFTVVFVFIIFALMMTVGMIPLAYPFALAIGMIPGGIVWAYMRVKVPRRFAIIIQCTLLVIIFYLAGSGWFISLGLIAGGILAELLTGIGKYRSIKWIAAGYAVFGSCVQLGLFAIALLARDYYYGYCVKNGMDKGYMDILMGFMSWPLLFLSTALTVVGALAGMLIGRAMLKKHFVKAGMIKEAFQP